MGNLPKLNEKEKKNLESRYNSRKKISSDFEKDFPKFEHFYNWYITKEKNGCAYCQIKQDELYSLFTKDKPKKLPLNDAKKRSSGTLEIERRNCKKGYQKNNMTLVCPLCNNAKSNLIDEDSWKELFAPAMKKYYNKLLNK